MREPSRLAGTHHPRMLKVDARAWVARASASAGRSVGFGDLPEEDLERIAGLGFELVWLTASWTIGSPSRRSWRATASMQTTRANLLPDGSDDDISGSPYAVAMYTTPRTMGGETGLRVLRRRLADAGIGLILDFIPNQTSTDHPWLHQHPDWFVQADSTLRSADPDAWFELRSEGRHWIAHGRDPNFPPWPDTAQLDYRHPHLRQAMIRQLRDVAISCDGVVCSMAMLILDDVFRATWDARSISPPGAEGTSQAGEFWWHAATAVREAYPRFLLLAEAYWGMEWRLQRLGFDFTLDKPLLDRLSRDEPASVVGHLRADDEYQRRSVRYLEDAGEPPIAARLDFERHRAAAVLTATVPGLLLLTERQLVGSRTHVPPQLGRAPVEPPDERVRELYVRLLRITEDEAFRLGRAIRIDPQAAWPGNTTHEGIFARLWASPHRGFRLAVVNLAAGPAQGYVPLPLPEFVGRDVRLEDLLEPITYVRAGDDLLARGLYLDLPSFGAHIFRITRGSSHDRRRARRS